MGTGRARRTIKSSRPGLTGRSAPPTVGIVNDASVPVPPSQRLRLPPRPCRWAPLLVALGLPLAAGALPGAAAAATVLERALRTGQVVMAGPSDSPPLVSLDAKGQPVGYAIELGKRIDAELRAQLGSRVQVRFESTANNADTVASVASGAVDLACGIPFTWERDQSVDYSLPIALSGVRLLSRNKAVDGSPDSLKGRRIAAVQGSVGASVLKDLQPGAVAVSFPSLEAAFTALQQGKVEGLMGDSIVLAGLNRGARGGVGRLVPEQPYVTYGVGCIIPENNSGFANIVNVAIARLMAGYVEGRPDAVASVDPWVGPKSVLAIPAERVQAFFLSVLLSREGVQSQPSAAPASAPAEPAAAKP